MSPAEIVAPVQAQQFAPSPRERAESYPVGQRPHGCPAGADGTVPGLSARLGRLALAQRQHHQGWR